MATRPPRPRPGTELVDLDEDGVCTAHRIAATLSAAIPTPSDTLAAISLLRAALTFSSEHAGAHPLSRRREASLFPLRPKYAKLDSARMPMPPATYVPVPGPVAVSTDFVASAGFCPSAGFGACPPPDAPASAFEGSDDSAARGACSSERGFKRTSMGRLRSPL